MFGAPRRRITKIERQKRNKERYAIFLDGEFAFGLDGEILALKGLSVGQELSEKEIEELEQEDERKRVKIQAFRYLANRDHSEKELTVKLRRKGFSAAAIAWVLEFLKQYKFVNDRGFADVFAHERLLQKPMGRMLLASELRAKGIAPAIIDEVIRKIYEEYDETELALSAARKKFHSLKNQPANKAKKKLADFLLRRGFGWEIVRSVLGELRFDEDNEILPED